MEDDGELAQSIDALIDCLDNLPPDYDICHLGKSQWYPIKHLEPVNSVYYTVVKQNINYVGAYIISKKFAKIVLDFTIGCVNQPPDDLVYGLCVRLDAKL